MYFTALEKYLSICSANHNNRQHTTSVKSDAVSLLLPLRPSCYRPMSTATATHPAALFAAGSVASGGLLIMLSEDRGQIGDDKG